MNKLHSACLVTPSESGASHVILSDACGASGVPLSGWTVAGSYCSSLLSSEKFA